MDQFELFRSKFKKIIYLKGKLTEANNAIKKYSRFDNNGSHKKHILKAIEIRDTVKKELEQELCGKTYDDWKETSKKLSKVKSSLTRVNLNLILYNEKLNKLTDSFNL